MGSSWSSLMQAAAFHREGIGSLRDRSGDGKSENEMK